MGNETLTREAGTGLKRIAFARGERIDARELSKLKRTMRTRKAGLKSKERAVTAAEKLMWTRMAALGCVACAKDGNFNPHVSIHHVDGRTKRKRRPTTVYP